MSTDEVHKELADESVSKPGKTKCEPISVSSPSAKRMKQEQTVQSACGPAPDSPVSKDGKGDTQDTSADECITPKSIRKTNVSLKEPVIISETMVRQDSHDSLTSVTPRGYYKFNQELGVKEWVPLNNKPSTETPKKLSLPPPSGIKYVLLNNPSKETVKKLPLPPIAIKKQSVSLSNELVEKYEKESKELKKIKRELLKLRMENERLKADLDGDEKHEERSPDGEKVDQAVTGTGEQREKSSQVQKHEEESKELKSIKKQNYRLIKENQRLKDDLDGERIHMENCLKKSDAMKKKFDLQMQNLRAKFSKKKIETKKKEELERFLREVGFTQTQVQVMTSTRKGKKHQGGWPWTHEEMMEASYQYEMGKDLYLYLRKNTYRQRPMPSKYKIKQWKALLNIKSDEKIECPHDTCLMTFDLRDHFEKHFNETHNLHKCQHCDKGFQQPLQLRNHVMHVHFNFKPWRCKICSNQYIQSNTLSMHIAVTHLKVARNQKDFYRRLGEVKPQVEEYKEKIPFSIIDANTAVCGEPNAEGGQSSLQLQEITKVEVEEEEEEVDLVHMAVQSITDYQES